MPQGNNLNAVTYGNGTFVAVGELGTILTSPDGVTWTIRTSGTSYGLNGITYGNNTFVAVGDTILTSPDGVSWTIRSSMTSGGLQGVTYGNNTFVAVAYSGAILTSPDGVSWTIINSGVPYGSGVTYGNGTFVAVGDSAILTSPDGVTWTTKNFSASLSLFAVTYGNGTFVAVGGTILTSPDGVSWTIRSSGISSGLYGVTYGNGTFVAVGDSAILTSPDGVRWTIINLGASLSLFAVTYANGTFVAVGSRSTGRYSFIGTILTSLDGVSWTKELEASGRLFFGVTYGNNTFVAVGDYGTILTSPDGVTWTIINLGASLSLFAVTYANGTFVAVGGTILTSPDGVSWTIRSSMTYGGLRGVTYGNNTFVAVGDYGTILTSPDGVTWTTRSSGTSSFLNGVTYGNGTFVAVGGYGTILQSDPLTGTAEISVDPTSLNFGDIDVGSSSDKIVKVRNDGNANLIIGTITSPSLPFTKIADDCSGQTFAPSASCVITYQFSPTSAGSFSSNSNIPSNDPDENPVTVSLNGVGVTETITIPSILTGPITGITGTSYSYTTGGSTSSLGHSLEYQFDWQGDGSDLSSWGPTTQSKTWTVAGTYTVKARARCATHTSVMSGWTSGLSVTISGLTETVSTPNPPSGPASGIIGISYSYSTGGATSNLGHLVEYQFDWKGDGTDLSPWGSATQSKTWTSAGTYNVKARARCTAHTSVVSGWSSALSVTISSAGPAVRHLPGCYTPSVPVMVTITVTPSATTSNYGVVETLPNGWTVSDINENGWWDNEFDNCVRWFFPDRNNRTLTYKATPPSGETGTKTFSGSAIFGEEVVTISGDSILQECPSETISTPTIPSGPTSGTAGTSYNYSTGGSSSNLGHSIQYLFDWGDGTNSGWLPVGTTSASKSWNSTGIYNVAVQARCAVHTSVVSPWSVPLAVTMSDVLHKRDEIIGTGGTWSSGIWYYNLDTKTWSKPYSYTPSGPIAVGDVTGDGKADMVSCWPSGLWYQNGATLAWTKVNSVAPSQVAVGDITGDGRAEIIGTWSDGIWYWNPATSLWTKMYSYVPSGPIAAGDVTGDGRADVVSVWPSGLWYQDGATLGWTRVSSVAPSQVAVGDITGDGRAEIIGTWNDGIWYWNPATSLWTKMYSYVPTGPIAAGDVTGDGRADVVSVWPSGLWYQDGATLGWTKVWSTAPSKIAVGDITGN